MAEAFLNKLFPDIFEAYSAGTEPSKINPYVVKAMAELGFDLSKNQTKHANEFLGKQIDLVVTVCDGAKETCPFFPGAKKYIHQAFDDPSGFQGTEREILENTRHVRDEIQGWLKDTFGKMNSVTNEE